jgi:PilZ domain-containing protein
MPEKRTELRKYFIARAKVLWEEPVGHSCLASAMVEDRSGNGLCVRVNQEISIGSKLEIRWHKEHLQGIVMNCRKDGFEYVLGVRRDCDDAAAEPL